MVDKTINLEEIVAESLIRMTKTTSEQFFTEYVIAASHRLETNLKIISILKRLDDYPDHCETLKAATKISRTRIKEIARQNYVMPTDPINIIRLDHEIRALLNPSSEFNKDKEISEIITNSPMGKNEAVLQNKIQELTNIIDVLKSQHLPQL